MQSCNINKLLNIKQVDYLVRLKGNIIEIVAQWNKEVPHSVCILFQSTYSIFHHCFYYVECGFPHCYTHDFSHFEASLILVFILNFGHVTLFQVLSWFEGGFKFAPRHPSHHKIMS